MATQDGGELETSRVAHAYSEQTRVFAIKAAVIGSLGGLVAGFDLGCCAAVLLPIAEEFQLSTCSTELFPCLLSFGALLGSSFAGAAADYYGRRTMLFVNAALCCIGSLLVGCAQQASTLFWGRFLLGIGVGLAFVVGTIYLVEVSPREWRGAITSCNELMVAVGMLMAFTCGVFVSRWRVTVLVPALLASLQAWCLISMPRSPRWLLQKGRRTEALEVLELIYASLKEQEEVFQDIQGDINTAKGSFVDIRSYLPELVATAMLLVFAELVGNGPVMAYAPMIFKEAGIAKQSSSEALIMVGCAKLLSTCIGILQVDKVGRRIILLAGSAGCSASMLLFLCASLRDSDVLWVAACLMFTMSWSPAFGSVALLLPSEVMPTGIRGQSSSIARFSGFATSMLMTGTFLSVQQALGEAQTFALLVVMACMAFMFVWIGLPETRGVPVHEIHEAFLQMPLWRCFTRRAPLQEAAE